MRQMSKNELKIFTTLVQMSQAAVMSTMETYLRNKYERVVKADGYLYAIGDLPITLMAHADTVFPTTNKEIFYDREKNVIWGGAEGLGADDRAGIFAIIRIIEESQKGLPHIIITEDEEKGCVGASKLVKNVSKPFAEMRYIIELDRRGKDDCVFYDCNNEEFSNYISSFGFTKEFGSFSDISEVCPVWGIAGVNLSVGYESEHSYSERLYVNHLLETISKVLIMLKDVVNLKDSFEYIPIQPIDLYQNYVQMNSLFMGDNITCHKCKSFCKDYEAFCVQEVNKEYHFWCPQCIRDNVKWCERCGEPFESFEDSAKLCYDCKGEGKKNYAVQRN